MWYMYVYIFIPNGPCKVVKNYAIFRSFLLTKDVYIDSQQIVSNSEKYFSKNSQKTTD